jgi:hypothetical protein
LLGVGKTIYFEVPIRKFCFLESGLSRIFGLVNIKFAVMFGRRGKEGKGDCRVWGAEGKFICNVYLIFEKIFWGRVAGCHSETVSTA